MGAMLAPKRRTRCKPSVTGQSRSSNVPTPPKASKYCPADGWSSAPSLGSGDACQRIEKNPSPTPRLGPSLPTFDASHDILQGLENVRSVLNQTLKLRAGSLHPRSVPPDAGTVHLVLAEQAAEKGLLESFGRKNLPVWGHFMPSKGNYQPITEGFSAFGRHDLVESEFFSSLLGRDVFRRNRILSFWGSFRILGVRTG